ncbi:hypothetical protein SAY87_008632 [Trapa incisa]|uniref:RRM domain-containing protein n=1 Tax=Trapa incisa TaxID=236973 RepID=A0AAN7JTY9_9MYRT|nr:hypothetical protein SAY87_008632 [Trapa incisa]
MDAMDNEAAYDGEGHEIDHSDHHLHHSAEDDRSHHHSGDGASPGKIFVGGLARETTNAQFVKHFGQYGEITDSVIMKDRKTGQPRGFGFVTYADPSVVDKVIEDTHVINGKQVEIKRTIPKGAAGSKDFKTKKIFVGGIPSTVNEDEFKDFFTQFGDVKEHQIMRDHATNRSRGFGFITFDSEDAVDDLLSRGNRLELAGTQVEVKRAEPKKPNPPPPPSRRYSDSRHSYGGGYGDAYGGYGGSGYGGYNRSGGAYGGRTGAYGGYGGGDFGGYGGYAGGGIGPYRGDPTLAYSSRYGGGGMTRGYDMGGPYGGGPGGGYGGYGGGAGGYGGGVGGYGGAGGAGGYDPALGGGYGGSSGGGGGSGSGFYGSRGGYGGGAGSNRYHPYGRYGYVTPDDVPDLLKQHVTKGLIIERLWRGQMGRTYIKGEESGSSNMKS